MADEQTRQLAIRELARRELARRKAAQPAPTLQERAREIYSFEPLAARGTILPMGRTQEGEVVPAFPQFMKDIAESALLPGHVSQGLVSEFFPEQVPGGRAGSFTPEDAARFALDIAAPMTAGRGVGAARSALPNKRGVVKQAPSDEALRKQARETLARAKGSGVVTQPESYLNMMADMETMVGMNKLNPTLHPRTTAAFQILSDNIGKEMDVEDLMIARRILGVAQRGVTPEGLDERRIAGLMEDMLDDYVANLSQKDLLAGDPAELGNNLTKFRNLWSRMKKSETIEGIIENAGIQASGFENGIRIGFRQLLKDPRRIRGFSEGERDLMRQIVEGSSGQKLLRLLGKLSFGTRGGSNWLGGTAGSSLGATAGGLSGGPAGALLGAAIPPAVGYAAQKGADAGAMRAAELARALAATGGNVPRSRAVDNLIRALMETGGPVLAAYPPEERRPLTESQLRDMF